MRLVTTIEIGMLTRAMSASIHEIQNIMPSDGDDGEQRVEQLARASAAGDCSTLSMSLVTRLSSSPRGWLSK